MNRHSRNSSESSFPSDQYQKEVWPGATMLAPVPIVMVTTQVKGGKPNICTIAWTGIVCSNPPMLSISLQKSRHSFSHLMEQKEFVVNIPPRHLAREVDMCGVISGRDEDKFEKTHLTPVPGHVVVPPLIRECPVNLECRVTQVIELGSHFMFIAEILRVHVQKRLINETGRLALERARLLSYAHGHYYAIGIRIGRYGFSVRKHRQEEGAAARKVHQRHEGRDQEHAEGHGHEPRREKSHGEKRPDRDHDRRPEREENRPREKQEEKPARKETHGKSPWHNTDRKPGHSSEHKKHHGPGKSTEGRADRDHAPRKDAGAERPPSRDHGAPARVRERVSERVKSRETGAPKPRRHD